MGNKTAYQTRQHDELLTYLKSTSGQHLTVNDVLVYFKTKGINIGTTTIYRQLEKMVNQGIVTKYIIDHESPACFEYVGTNSHHEGGCYHCKCEKCGKLVHMHCEEIPQLQKHVKEHHGFIIDPLRTVFYGICENCASEN